MTYTGLEFFIIDLKKLIEPNGNPRVNSNPSFEKEIPQLNLLCQELESIIQTLFVDQGDNLVELVEVRDLKKRFTDAAKEAECIIDLFVSHVYFRSRGHSPTASLNLEDVMKSIMSIKEESMNIPINSMRPASSRITEFLEAQTTAAAAAAGANISLGLNDDALMIVDKLIAGNKPLDIISIVGMGGLGKTCLAAQIYNNQYVEHYYVRAWVTVSQTFEKRDFLISILASMGDQLIDLREATEFQLRDMLHQKLFDQKYFIVIDDIWTKKVWDEIKLFFPNDNNESRILLSTRHTEVALHAKPHGFIHHLRYLTEGESWELLCRKVFHDDESCPEWLIEPGRRIAEQCHGLPLAVVILADVLANKERSKDIWEEVAGNVNRYIKNDQNGRLERLALSYYHLPGHLRDCFLYIGGFPQDIKFPVRRLIWLWLAEGFIIQKAEKRSFEDMAEDYLMELVDRNLLIVSEKKFNGAVKAWKVHDLVRVICLQKAEEDKFFVKMMDWQSLSSQEGIKQRRVFTDQDIHNINFAHPSSIRSLLCFHEYAHSIYTDGDKFCYFKLLKVLDLQTCKLKAFPPGMALIIHLRYLAIWNSLGFPSSICDLSSLQTLIVKTSSSFLELPHNISDLVNLRHLRSDKGIILPLIDKPMNLQTISKVVSGDGVKRIWEYFPCIKKIAFTVYLDEVNDIKLPCYLEILKLTGSCRSGNIAFPETLKKLTLVGCCLPWDDMKIIHLLPNLEVLRLIDNAFDGTKWDAGEDHFGQLKLLRLEGLNIKQWIACSISFPCLKQLEISNCHDLEEVPSEIGSLLTLELIKIESPISKSSVGSLQSIQDEQHDAGNDQLKIIIDGTVLSPVLDSE